MSRITQKNAPTRCTLCKRNKQKAIIEQVAQTAACDTANLTCDFLVEIKEAIELKYRLNITPKIKKNLSVVEKDKVQIQIVRRK